MEKHTRIYKDVSGKREVHQLHIASNQYRSLHMDLCNTW